MKAIITVGVSASGKTTWAKEKAKQEGYLITNRDDLRFSLTGASGWAEYKFDKRIENIITDMQEDAISSAALHKKNIIIADTNLNPLYRERLVTYLSSFGYEDIEIKPFPITLEEALRRDSFRANGVGKDVIYKQWKQWLEFSGRKRYVPDISKPKAIMFDIDGTLANMNGRGPFDWQKVDTDVPDIVIREMYWDFYKRGYKMIILSGRDGSCYDKTYSWLIDNGIMPWAELLMREAGDNRKDIVIKEEIFWRDIEPYYNVCAVVDDRPCVVRMWQDVGISKVIAVGDQNLEF